MLEIYTIAGGEWLFGQFNAISAFMRTDTWKLIEKIALLFSVLVVAVSWVRRHNVMDMVGWGFAMVFIAMMVIIRTPVQIIDNSNVTQVWRVDNVPVGLALPASLTTRIGHAMVLGYELIFSLPDSVTYSKSGMLFGASLIARSTDFLSQNSEITTLFSDYVQNCVTGDMFLNHKYSVEELMNTQDPYTLIFSNPSPLRGVFNRHNQFHTCADIAADLKNKLVLDTTTGGHTWGYYVRQLFGGRPSPDLLFSQLISDSYGYFYSSGQSASQIIRQNVTMNALRNGIPAYAARSGDTSSLLNIATTSSLEKQRLAHASVGQVAMRTLPITHTVLMGILIGLFPVMLLAGMFSAVTLQVVKGYVFTFIWLQTWPLLYAVLNSAMTFYARQNGAPVVLSELSSVQVKYSDIATTAGYISMMIPFLSWKMVMGLGPAFSSISSSLGSASLSSASQSASGVVDGNYSFANMQTDNVNGYSWNTNSTTSFGQLTHQLDSGATATKTRGGATVLDSSGAMSRLPVEINMSRQISSAQQQMSREAESLAQSAMHGFNSNISSAWNTLQQFTGQRGSSNTISSGADNTQSGQSTMMAGQMRNAVESYAKANNISSEQATQELAQRAVTASAGLSASLTGKAKVGLSFLGTGGGIEATAGGRTGIDGSDSDSHSASRGSRAAEDSRHDKSTQDIADFKRGFDYFVSQKTTQSGSHSENNSDSRVDQLAASFSRATSSYDHYTDNLTRSREYAAMASRTETLSGQMSENLTQRFADFVMQRSPQNAERLLTDTHSPDIAAQREHLAREFVRGQIKPAINADAAQHQAVPGSGTQTNAAGARHASVQSDYSNNRGRINHLTAQAGLSDDVGSRVGDMLIASHNAQHRMKGQIEEQSDDIQFQSSHLKEHHEAEKTVQDQFFRAEQERQRTIAGAYSSDELTRRANEIQDKKSLKDWKK